ncbi:olfactomedin-4 isoform X2 [Sphaeramia orbicularis]|uniref:olfactomedin-4 isoform X2 n=1 Tax=Sphaeramia orbicularis TaxID=375764 RepID=UPI00117C8CB9|nr:olfactomedin-4-like isoform X2 [Sphaeramia orbicularis]
MKRSLVLSLFQLFQLFQLITVTQSSADSCVCELINSQKPFPHDRLNTAKDEASRCNRNISLKMSADMDTLLLALDRRLPQIQSELSLLEVEDDRDLYGLLSLVVIENELLEITQILEKLNGSTEGHQRLTANTQQQIMHIKEELKDLQELDTMEVVKRQQANQRLKRDLDQCRNGLRTKAPTTSPPPGLCPYGRFMNVSGPRVFTAGEYPGSFKYGAWGRDPKPDPGKEHWYWMVPMASSNRYAHYVRRYSSLSSLIVGVSLPGNVMIHSSNPTTNTVQGPNVVMYGEALYYNCYNRDAVCRFNLTTKTISDLQLPRGTRFNNKANYCHLEECYPFTDLDLATDESGVWVIYTTNDNFGNLVLSKIEEGNPLKLGQTLQTSVYKQAVTNAFMACGVLYVTRYVNRDQEEIFYSLDTVTGDENFNVGIIFHKVLPNILALNYSPVDQMLHAYCDSNMVSYKVLFE